MKIITFQLLNQSITMKSIFVPFVISLCFGFNLFSQESDIFRDTLIYKNVMDEELKAYIFYPSNANSGKSFPAIASFHGGGWAYGNPSEFFGACKRYARKGFVTFSFQYRLSINDDGTVPHPEITPVECVKDARTAMRWLKENAEKLKIDPEKIIVSGQSAGGQLALSTALAEDVNESSDNLEIDPTPAAFILYSSNVNTVEAWADMLLADRRDEIWSISPQHTLKPGLPPAIEFHGTGDPTVNYWIVDHFMESTRALGNYFELIPLEGREHYLGPENEKYATYFDEEIMERTDEFLNKFGVMPEEVE